MAAMLFCYSSLISGQQLDRIGDDDPLKLNGGISLNQLYRNNVSHGMKPYSMVATGNLTANLYGMSIPFSFSWSNEQWTYTQPFNRFALSPSYKWATLHLGWASMSFSPYSLGGHSFFGVGTELSPGDKFRISAMYGELLKSGKGDSIRGIDPTYQRTGSGLKVDYNFEKGEVSLMLFQGRDNIDQPVDYIDSLGIVPLDNIVLGTRITLRPVDRLSLVTEVHASSFSNDLRISSAGNFNGAATYQYYAANLQMAYSTRIGNLGAGIEYVEPGYETLGAYYTVNDFINYTLNYSTSLLNGRISLSANSGVRVNNLNDDADSNRRDVISSISAGVIPVENLMFNISYSNFYNYTHVRPLIDELVAQTEYELMDTLRFTQINENINLGLNWRVSDTEINSHAVMANVGFQQATQTQNSVEENAGNRFMNGSAGYQFSQKERKLNVSLNVNYSRNKSPELLQESIGPMVSLRKAFPETSLSGNFSVGWNGTYQNGSQTGSISTTRLALSYVIKEFHRLGFNTAFNHRIYNSNANKLFTASLNYSYSFGWPPSKNSNQNTR